MPRLPFPRPDREDCTLLALLRTGDPLPELPPLLEVDWEEVFARARAQRVAPLALQRLGDLPPGALPAGIEERRQSLWRGWMARAVLQEIEIRRAVLALHGEGIRPQILKGPALGRLAYGDPALRPSADLDLLVPGARYEAALRALEGADFRLRDAAQSERYHRRFHYHDVLVGHRGLLLELHWGLSRADDLFHLDPEAFLAHGTEIEGTLPAAWTSPTDLLLHTAAQALAEGFTTLHRVVDADRLVRRCGSAIDTARLTADAARGGLGPSLRLLLDLAAGLLATPVEPRFLPARPGPLVRTGLASLDPAASLASGYGLSHAGLRSLLTFWLVDGGRRRLQALVRVVRVQELKAALDDPAAAREDQRPPGASQRLLTLVKLIGYQAASLLALPFRRRAGVLD